MVAATLGIGVLYVVSFFMSMFGMGQMPIMDLTNSSAQLTLVGPPGEGEAFWRT